LNKTKSFIEENNASFVLTREHKTELECIKSLKRKSDISFCKSDKTNRIIAMNLDSYEGGVKESLGNLTEVRGIKPVSAQQKFNKTLKRIANKYSDNIKSSLSQCVCSEPLPKRPYGLPKDHKDGTLKCRPIVSSIPAASRKLCILLSKVLKPILDYIPTHIKSSADFLSRIPPTIPENSYYGSLDVKNLYGSIPLVTSTNSPSVFDICSSIFMQYNEMTSFSGMERSDFLEILKLCLNFDSIYFEEKTFVQQSGIPMGNNLAPILAIFYMHSIEQILLSYYGGLIKTFIRYIDDIFFIADESIPLQILLEKANAINPAIQFTAESPNDKNSLPFLDTLITYNPQLSYQLYIKPIHSNSVLHSSSHVPLSRKVNLIRNEFRRSKIASSSPQNLAISHKIMYKRFTMNGYKQPFLNKYTALQLSDNRPKDFISFVKLPFQNEITCRKIRQFLQSAGLQTKIRLIFETRPPLHRQLAPRKRPYKCPAECLPCQLAEKPGLCFQKGYVYKITCRACSNFVYFGESKRLASTRISEHTTDKLSLVYKHMHQHHPNNTLEFSWTIIMPITNWHTRTAVEHMLAKENGCFDQKVRELNYAVIT